MSATVYPGDIVQRFYDRVTEGRTDLLEHSFNRQRSLEILMVIDEQSEPEENVRRVLRHVHSAFVPKVKRRCEHIPKLYRDEVGELPTAGVHASRVGDAIKKEVRSDFATLMMHVRRTVFPALGYLLYESTKEGERPRVPRDLFSEYRLIWKADLERFIPRPLLACNFQPQSSGRSTERDCVFRRDGDQFEVVFRGKTTKYTSTHGMRYIHLLLSSVDEIPLGQMEEITRKVTVKSVSETAEIPPTGFQVNEHHRADRDEIEERQEQLKEAREAYRVAPSPEKKNEWNAAIKFLDDWFKKYTIDGRRARAAFSDPGEKARQRIRKALGVAYQNIRKKDTQLAGYLRDCIKVSTTAARYESPDGVEWFT